MIKDAYNLNGRLLNEDYFNLKNWAIELKIVKSKKCVKVKTIIQVKTKASVHSLCQNQKDYCDQNNIKIISKKAGLDYTKKIRILSGACLLPITTLMIYFLNLN